jgi:DNA topoisomerase-1
VLVDTGPAKNNLASLVSKSLVIVESPAKARTISAFLGKGYVVESSIGHIRDLPRSAADIPLKYKKEPWARLGVDTENGFKPLYIIDPDKKEHIKKLKQLTAAADEVLLATDEDREGESIAWHLLEVLEPKVPVKRMVFHEITERAIKEAIENPRDLDRRLVDAQEARRILDRLYGYEVSPVLWKKVMPRLSAGRVQSVATRIIVERERERISFRSASYWDIEAEFEVDEGTPKDFPAQLTGVGGQKVATGKDFDDRGVIRKEGIRHLTEAEASGLAKALEGQTVTVKSVERKPNRRSPAPPFMTSTLQQEAGRKLRFSSSRTMRAAQRLYENGYITYMRTDSTTLSETAITAARACIKELYGAEYLPESPRLYKKKVKNAQEAHEAIRPAGDAFRRPEEVTPLVGPDEAKVYELVWKRTVASQMQDARGEGVSVQLMASGPEQAEFSVRGNTIVFPGFLRAYVEGSDDPGAELENRERPLPPLTEGQTVEVKSLKASGHETQPPARYTEASLVRRLEELGVGRPSTYASIIGTILDRGYVWKRGNALVPSFRAFAVIALMEQHFGDLVDYAFTARMEDELDEIAGGAQEMLPWLKGFYYGVGKEKIERPLDVGLHALVSNNLGEIDARAINTLPIGEDPNGNLIVGRVGRYGAYLQRGEETASIPDDLAPDELTLERAMELLSAPSGDRLLGTHPETGLSIYAKNGRFGAFVQAGELEKGGEKPQTSSLLKTQKAETITLEEALALLSLPRLVGKDPDDGQEIFALLGRYGPYVRKEKDSRSLESEEQIFTLTVEQAKEIFAQPRRRAGQRKAAEPLRELGTDPVSDGTITLREGRFGHYVTDGETNASLRKEDDPNTITPERAQELLQLRRERGPVKKKTKKKPAKKAASKAPAKAAKKPAAPKAAKKAPAEKAPAKKVAAKKAAKKTTKKKSAKKTSTKKTAKKAVAEDADE